MASAGRAAGRGAGTATAPAGSPARQPSKMTDFSHVADEYDRIGSQYQESKRLPFRGFLEEHSLFNLLPDLAGRSVVDLACGEGIYSRKLKRGGAARVVGVDISSEMIALAERAEAAEPLGVRYLVADVATVELDERFDIALCSYLFNYARSRAELRSLVQSVHGLLRPGGLVVGCNDYPDNVPAELDTYRRYGFTKVRDAQPGEGDTITYRFFNADGTEFELDNYFLPTEAYRDEFANAGFSSFGWVMLEVSPARYESRLVQVGIRSNRWAFSKCGAQGCAERAQISAAGSNQEMSSIVPAFRKARSGIDSIVLKTGDPQAEQKCRSVML
jgi:toxoflavin synthase